MEYQINAETVDSSAVLMMGKDQNGDIWVLPKAGDWAYQYEHQYMRQEVLDIIDYLLFDELENGDISFGTLWSDIKRPYAEKKITSKKMGRDEFLTIVNQYPVKTATSWNQVETIFSW
jgi:hypothetical protein